MLNLKVVHYIQLFLGAIIAGSASIASNEPQWSSTAHTVAAVCASLLTVLGIISPAAGGGSMTVTSIVNKAVPVAMFGLTMVFGSVFVTACTKAQAANDVAVVTTVLADADRACIDINLALAAFQGIPQPVSSAIETTCNIATNLDAAVNASIAAWNAQPSAAKLGSIKAAGK